MIDDEPESDATPPSADPPPAAPPGAPPDAPPDAPPPTRWFRRRAVRLAALGALGAALAGTAIVVVASRSHGDPSTAEPAGSGSASRAPDRPRMQPHPGGPHLSGFVVDGAGLPVAGAEVSVELERGAADRASSAKPGAVAIAPPTAADGRFTIDALEPGRYRVRVSGPGLLAAEVRYVPVPSDAARIVVARQVAIDGTVTDGGKPVANVSVGLRGDAIGGSIETTSDAAGAFHFTHLPEGRYQLWAWRGALAARTVRVSRVGSGPSGSIELRLEAAAIVVGRVIDRDEGTGLVAAIELRPSGEDQAPRYARSSSDGVFRIEGVPNGRWIADAFAPGYISPNGLELDAGKAVTELALVRGAAVEGRVVDGEGHPIAGATVRAITGAATAGASASEVSEQVDQDRLRRFSGHTVSVVAPATPNADPQLIARGELGVMVGPIPPIPPPGTQAARPATVVDPAVAGGAASPVEPLAIDPARASIWTTGADGRYRIRGIAKGSATVLAQAPGYAEARSKPIAIKPGEVQTGIDLVLTRGTFLVGRVTDQHGMPIAGAELSAQPEVGAPVEGFTDASGEYRLGPLAGILELRVRAYGHGETKRSFDLGAAKGAATAEHREDIVLSVADAMIAGTVDDVTGVPVVGAQLEVIAGAEGRRAVAASDGTFSIDMLPAGHLKLRVEHPAYPPQELDVVASTDGGARVRIRLPLGGAVEGALLDGANGAPLSSVSITGSGPGGATAEVSTDKAGRWKLGPLKPGRWKLAVKLAGYLPIARELDVPAASSPGASSLRDVRIDLPRGALVGGTVRDASGRRVSGAHVAVRAGDITVEGDTDAQGEFRIHDAPTGELEVTATKGDARGATTATVRAGDELLGLSIELR